MTFLSDGGETVRNLPLYLNPLAELLLDGFHVAMRLTVMGQRNQGMKDAESVSLLPEVERQLESLQPPLWNGNVVPALRSVDLLQRWLDDEKLSPERSKLLRAVREFGGYLALNQRFIPDYGDRYRNNETITTAFVESTVNPVVSKRCVKSQQRRWSQCRAHLLLQVRTHVLNDELRDRFQRWYPGIKIDAEPEQGIAAQ